MACTLCLEPAVADCAYCQKPVCEIHAKNARAYCWKGPSVKENKLLKEQ